MNRIARLPVLAAATIALLTTLTGCKQLEARNQLNQGVEAFKAAEYEQAVDHFQKAVQLDPKFPMTKTYLATAYAAQVVPDLKTPQNTETAQMAINTFKQVLEQTPNDVNSLAQIANLYMDLDQFDLAKQWNEKVLAADSKNAQAAYTIGVIDWRVTYKNSQDALKSSNLTDDGSGNAKMPKQICEDLKQKNADLVQEGMKYLNQALQIDPTYDNAMSYLNLMYRQQANIECTDKSARDADVQLANQWSAKALTTRRENEEKKAKVARGIVLSGK